MKVYHGSYVKIDKIDLTQCRPNRDFGRGFYVTKFLHHAETWSTVVGRRHHTQGMVSEFEYVESSFQLADESTGLHLKTWQEIYELLKRELR